MTIVTQNYFEDLIKAFTINEKNEENEENPSSKLNNKVKKESKNYKHTSFYYKSV
ncbi:hypothetical protein NEIRO03_1689 [Nematocida sp. AWRm78]|nr:hypothetical protein NEIRO03_1689 [Nematocida sp. AWRm78]